MQHDASYPWEEPGAGNPHARIREGESRMAELLDHLLLGFRSIPTPWCCQPSFSCCSRSSEPEEGACRYLSLSSCRSGPDLGPKLQSDAEALGLIEQIRKRAGHFLVGTVPTMSTTGASITDEEGRPG